MRLAWFFGLLVAVAALDAATLLDARRTPCLTPEQRGEVEPTELRAMSQPDPDGCGLPRARGGAAETALGMEAVGFAALATGFLRSRWMHALGAAAALSAALWLGFLGVLFWTWGAGCGPVESRFGDACVRLAWVTGPAFAALLAVAAVLVAGPRARNQP